MSLSFEEVLRRHTARYPQMLAQDYLKLAYQSEYGPEHLLAHPEAADAALREEWQNISLSALPAAPEPIGNGLCRFPLTSIYRPERAAPLLASLFVRTAAEHTGTAQGMQMRLAAVLACGTPGIAQAVEAYRCRGCPPVHHSAAFRAAYNPHYRLLKIEYACFFSALLAAAELAQSGRPAVIGIEGRCGSGKTALAALIQSLFPCNVYHMDDFYLPPGQRAPHWQEQTGGNMDFARFRREVLGPVAAGKPVLYRAYSCEKGAFLPPRLLAPQPLSIVEGSYSAHPALGAAYTLQIFISCPPEEQARRLKAREGAYFSAFAEQWIPREEQYFQECETLRHSTFFLDTALLSLC